MRYTSAILIGAFALSVSGCATEYSVSPVADGSQQVRYDHGQPTIYSETKFGAVQITAMGVNSDHRLGFGVAVANKGHTPTNFGVENVSLVQADGTAGKMLTSIELVHEAKVQAGWKMFGAALAGAGQAYAASQSARTTTMGTVYTPAGPASYFATTYNPALAQQGITEAGAQTNANLGSIKADLDQTLASIHDSVLQTTTVNPGDSYGGIAIADTLSSSSYPQAVTLHVNWNGEDHAFRFNVSKGEEAVVQQANQPVPPTPLVPSSAAKLPYGYIAAADLPPASADEQQPAMVSYDQWQKDHTPPATHRTKASPARQATATEADGN